MLKIASRSPLFLFWVLLFSTLLAGSVRPHTTAIAPLSLLPVVSIFILYPRPQWRMLIDFRISFLAGIFLWSMTRALLALLLPMTYPWVYGRNVYAFYVMAMGIASALPLLIGRKTPDVLVAFNEIPEVEKSPALAFRAYFCLLLAATIAVGLVGGSAMGLWGFIATNLLKGLFLVLLSTAYSMVAVPGRAAFYSWIFWSLAIFPFLWGAPNRTAFMFPTSYVVLVCVCQFAEWKRLNWKAWLLFLFWMVMSLVGGTIQKMKDRNLVTLVAHFHRSPHPMHLQSEPKTSRTTTSGPAIVRSPVDVPSPVPVFVQTPHGMLRSQESLTAKESLKAVYADPTTLDHYFGNMASIFHQHYYSPGGLLFQDLSIVFPRAYFPSKRETDLSRRAYNAGIIRDFLYEELFLEPALDFGLPALVLYYALWLLGIYTMLRLAVQVKVLQLRRFSQASYLLGSLCLGYSLRGPHITFVQYLAAPVFIAGCWYGWSSRKKDSNAPNH